MGGYIPSQRDINNHFSAGAPIRRTRRIYDRISNNKDYKFGELTSLFLRYDEDQDDVWQTQIRSNGYNQVYTDLIKKYVIEVLSMVNPTDLKSQVSLTFVWINPTGNPPGTAPVTLSQTGDAYTITISGLRAPPA
jgi:hypothetical protein